MYNKLLNKIKEYNKITIFRHVRPDGDCMFASLALYHFLKDNFKNKQIKVCGFDKFDLISKNDKTYDSFIMDSLSIVLDTSTSERIDDFRALASKYLIKIDHHPDVEDYSDLKIVDPFSSSACQILSKIFFSKTFSKYKISKKICEYLYSGIVTDTLNFKTSNTTAETLNIASKLVEKGDLIPSDIVEYLMNNDLKTFNKISLIRNKLTVSKKFGYIKLSNKDLKEIDIDFIKAKNQIDEIGNISDLNIWAIAVENNNVWDCSIRSKRKFTINNIAKKYRGGGHKNASAVKQISNSELNSLFKDLEKVSCCK